MVSRDIFDFYYASFYKPRSGIVIRWVTNILAGVILGHNSPIYDECQVSKGFDTALRTDSSR